MQASAATVRQSVMTATTASSSPGRLTEYTGLEGRSHWTYAASSVKDVSTVSGALESALESALGYSSAGAVNTVYGSTKTDKVHPLGVHFISRPTRKAGSPPTANDIAILKLFANDL